MSHQSDLISEDILAYLGQHERKELLRFLTCGNVDDGKSTLIGRLLHDSKMIYEDHLEAITRDSKKVGTTGDDVDLALLVAVVARGGGVGRGAGGGRGGGGGGERG
ncbi:GTP-binding protein, partial [Pseudomonas aeruginosa]|uniref:GTP-binding protein n=1 Tax=Pseudomonas aeruginosa TaxID=287 RepID=UPI00211B2122